MVRQASWQAGRGAGRRQRRGRGGVATGGDSLQPGTSHRPPPRTLHSTFAPSPCFASTAHAAASRALRSDGTLGAGAASWGAKQESQERRRLPVRGVAHVPRSLHHTCAPSTHGEAHNSTAGGCRTRRRAAGKRGCGGKATPEAMPTGVTHLSGSSSRLRLRAGVGHQALHVARHPPRGPAGAVPRRPRLTAPASLCHHLLRHEGHGSLPVCVWRLRTAVCTRDGRGAARQRLPNSLLPAWQDVAPPPIRWCGSAGVSPPCEGSHERHPAWAAPRRPGARPAALRRGRRAPGGPGRSLRWRRTRHAACVRGVCSCAARACGPGVVTQPSPLVQHPPVFTVGKRCTTHNVKATPQARVQRRRLSPGFPAELLCALQTGAGGCGCERRVHPPRRRRHLPRAWPAGPVPGGAPAPRGVWRPRVCGGPGGRARVPGLPPRCRRLRPHAWRPWRVGRRGYRPGAQAGRGGGAHQRGHQHTRLRPERVHRPAVVQPHRAVRHPGQGAWRGTAVGACFGSRCSEDAFTRMVTDRTPLTGRCLTTTYTGH